MSLLVIFTHPFVGRSYPIRRRPEARMNKPSATRSMHGRRSKTAAHSAASWGVSHGSAGRSSVERDGSGTVNRAILLVDCLSTPSRPTPSVGGLRILLGLPAEGARSVFCRVP